MYHFRILRARTWFAISLILGFALITFGCTKKNQASDFSNIKISAKAVPEGIRVTFSNYSKYSDIPPEIDNLKIVFYDWGEDGEPDWNDMDMPATFNYFHDHFRESFCENALEQVRKNGKVTFPFVKKGHKYTIRALFISDNKIEKRISAECVAKNGVQINNISLELNSANTCVTLSDKPSFTPNVKSELQKISYNIVICADDNWPAIASDKTDDLSWDFEPRFSEYLKENNVANGNYQAYTGANLYITYNKISWILEIAKSQIFTYSF
jgi:hypothetical protein